MAEVEIKIDGDVESDPRRYVSGYTTATGAGFRISGPLAEAIIRLQAAAYERGWNDMKERAAKAAEPTKHRPKVQWGGSFDKPKKDPASSASIERARQIAAAIRALPLPPERGW